MARRGAGEGNIRERKDGRWEARLRYTDPVDGLAKRQHFYGRTRKEVTELLQEAQRRIALSEPVRDEGASLMDFLDWWLENVVQPSRREQTFASYSSIIDNRIAPTPLATIALRDLRPATIQSVLVNLRRPPTRSDALAVVVLRTALSYAVKARMLHANPAAEVETPRPPRREMRALTKAEAHRFLKAARTDRLFALYYLALHTGMRSGELLHVEWRDVDLPHKNVRVMRSLKTRSARRLIALGPEAVTVLRAHRARMLAEGHADGRVFVSAAGKRLDPANFQRNSFKPLLEAASCPNVRFHDLRHTAATLLLDAGVHPKIVSERLGHASIAITMDLYQHVSPTMQRGAARAMDRALSLGSKRVGQAGGQRRKKKPRRKKKNPAKR
ncbi:MAG: tyrosine-type recombinase/integrase [Candidatus Tyrphobacter sp.]